MPMNKKGRLFIISGPSGVGKSTILKIILEKCQQLHYSVSYTTRRPRPGERNGVNYHFVTEEDFKIKIANNDFAEWAEVHGNFYGTCAKYISSILDSGKDVVMDIDVVGATNLIDRYPDAISIFLTPPNWIELERRLIGRATEPPDIMARRLITAKMEIARSDRYNYVISNDDIDKTIGKLMDIFQNVRTDG